MAGERRGFALLFSVGMLALLSLLAAVFVSQTQLDRGISANYVLDARAALLAESGMASAMARLLDLPGGMLPASAMEAMACSPGDPAMPLEQTLHPSFGGVLDVGGVPMGVSGVCGGTYVENGDHYALRVQDASGKLNLNDSNGRYNIDTDPRADDPLTEAEMLNAPGRLHKIVEYLVERLFGDVGNFKTGGNGTGLGTAVADKLFTARETMPGGRFASFAQVRALLVEDDDRLLTAVQFEELRRHVTLWSWQDLTVIRPTYTVKLTVHWSQEAGIPGNPDTGWDVYLYFDYQTKGFAMEPRCPVNINAASQELIEALLAPVQGWLMVEGPAEWKMTDEVQGDFNCARLSYTYADQTLSNSHWGPYPPRAPGALGEYYRESVYGRLYRSRLIGRAGDLAHVVYSHIHTDGRPFGAWDEFTAFLRGEDVAACLEPDSGFMSMVPPGGNPDHRDTEWWRNYLKDMYVDLILANANPNSRLNDYNPDRHVFRHVDKAQLTQYTTEFCFEPTGTFDLEALGRVCDAQGGILASRRVEATVDLWTMLRVTSQAQFLHGLRDGGENLGDYFSVNDTGAYPTAGAEPDAGFRGYTLQSYPEPVVNAASYFINPGTSDFNYIDDCACDGALALATWQARRDSVYEAPRFLANFNSTLKPEVFNANGTLGSNPTNLDTDDMCGDGITEPEMIQQTPEELRPLLGGNPRGGWVIRRTFCLMGNQPTALRLCNPANLPRTPGVLHPDGALSDAGRTLSYRAANLGSDSGMSGSIEFWLKPNFNPAVATRIRTFFEMGRPNEGDFSHYLDGPFQLAFFPCDGSDTEYNCPWQTLWVSPFSTTNVRSLVYWWTQWGMHTGAPQYDRYMGSVGRATQSVVHDYPGSGVVEDTDGPQFHVEMREWTHVALAWNMRGNGVDIPEYEPNRLAEIAVNGKLMSPERAFDPTWADILPQNTPSPNMAEIHEALPLCTLVPGSTIDMWTTRQRNGGAPAVPNYFRFGEFASRYEFGAFPLSTIRNFSCDATLDDVVGYADGTMRYDARVDAWVPRPLPETYGRGRYLADVDAKNTAARYQAPRRELFAQLPGVRAGDSLTPRAVAYTLYWPRQNRDAMDSDNYLPVRGVNVDGDILDPDSFEARELGWTDAWDPISIDIAAMPSMEQFRPAPVWYYGNDKAAMATRARGTDFRDNNSLAQAFRYRGGDVFWFQVEFNLDEGQTLYQSPVLDDVTFSFQYQSPRVLYWAMR